MKKLESAMPLSGRYLLLQFAGEAEPRICDTFPLRKYEFEKLNNPAFFGAVFIEKESAVAWEGGLRFSADFMHAKSVPLSEALFRYFDEAHPEEARDSVHDRYVSIFNKKPDEGEISRILHALPRNIVSLAAEWGWNDTEVRDKIYAWMEKNCGPQPQE